MSGCRTPLLDAEEARPSAFGTDKLSERQQLVDERIRTLCLVVVSVSCVSLGAYYLRTILIRFVLALALRYLLTPLIDLLACRNAASCKFKLPRGVAILISLALTAALLGVLTLVVARSIGSFAAHSDNYAERAEQLLQSVFDALSKLEPSLLPPPVGNRSADEMQHAIAELAKSNLNLQALIVGLLGTAAHVTENVIYILLFLAFLLAGQPPRRDGVADVHAEAEEQIYVYIRGKVAIALLVALCDSAILCVVGVNLWLVFGIVTFWLNFVPNVGLAVACVLPMPLVLLDAQFGPAAASAAFFGPAAVGMFAKDVLEPSLIGHSTSLTPVAVLLSVMIWGSVWGVTGMVLAVPLTAVIRIYLQGLEHPLAKWCALVLAGRSLEEEEDAGRRGAGRSALVTPSSKAM